MAIGTVVSCGVDSVAGKTPSELWNEVNADGQVTPCEASRLRALHSEYTAKLSGNSANTPRFNNEAEMTRELAALQKIAQLCSSGTNSCESVPDQIVAKRWDGSSLGALAMSNNAATAAAIAAGLALATGVAVILNVCDPLVRMLFKNSSISRDSNF